jgi:hypothetical protein
MVNNLNQTVDKMYSGDGDIHKDDIDTNQDAPIETNDVSLVKNKASIFHKAANKIKEFSHRQPVIFKYSLLAISILASFFILKEVERVQSLNSVASTRQAAVYFQVLSADLPPESPFDVWVNSDSTVGFVDLEITFDPNVIKLAGEITPYQSLTRIIKITPMAEANSTGKISIILGLDPSKITSPPAAPFRVAALKLNAKTTNSLSTTITFNNSIMQLVSLDQSVFTTTTTGLTLNLNPTPTPTATATPKTTPTTSPTVKPTSTPTATSNPTSTPVQTKTPIATDKSTATPSTSPHANLQISGTVMNSSNSAPISGATVRIRKVSARWWQRSTIVRTDRSGHYGVNLPENTYNISISKWNYRTISQRVTLRVNTILNFQLHHR